MAAIDDIREQFDVLLLEHSKFVEKGNNAAGTRARKAAMELSKLMKSLRTEIQASKNLKKQS